MRAPLTAVALVALSLVLAVSAVPARAVSAPPIDDEPDCNEAVPAAAGYSGVTDDGVRVSLDVDVLLDGVSAERGRAVMRRAAKAYAPHGIVMRSSFESVRLTGDDPVWLIQQAKHHFGGRAPKGTDVVYVLTSEDLNDATLGRAVAGMADCIGGVRYRQYAFAVGENFADENEPLGPLNLNVYASAKVAGHEIGHLLGAHHHYANCAEGIPSETSQREASPCTLMFNSVDLSSLYLGALEASVVRGHAVEFATP